MRAAVLTRPGEPLHLLELANPDPGPGELLVRVGACGVCRTDLHIVDAERIGLYGFGAAAHIVAQVAVAQGRRVFAFTRPGDADAQAFARELGAEWAGPTTGPPPEELDAAIIFAPAGELVPAALQALA